MKSRILGGIGVVWGGGVLLYTVLGEHPPADGPYQTGQAGAVIFGLALLLVGAYYLLRGAGKTGEAKRAYPRAGGSSKLH